MKKVWVLTVTAGAGHLRAAQALVKAYHKLYPHIDVSLINVLEYTNRFFQKAYPSAYFHAVDKLPEFYGWLYRTSNNRLIYRLISYPRSIYNRFNAMDFIKYLQKGKPELIICTHFLPAQVISALRRRGIRTPYTACIITDFGLHTFWIYKNLDLYIVPSEESRILLNKQGVDKVEVLGIPIDPVFAESKSKRELAERFGLDKDVFTVLVLCGGFGVGPIEKIVRRLQDVNRPIQIIVVAGKNPVLKYNLSKSKLKKRTKILGFIDNMDEVMTISDLLISKPGGLTVSECMSKTLPMIIVNPTPGQEYWNTIFLLKNGIAFYIEEGDDIVSKVEGIVDNWQKFGEIKNKIEKYATPYSAIECIEKIKKNYNGSRKDL